MNRAGALECLAHGLRHAQHGIADAARSRTRRFASTSSSWQGITPVRRPAIIHQRRSRARPRSTAPRSTAEKSSRRRSTARRSTAAVSRHRKSTAPRSSQPGNRQRDVAGPRPRLSGNRQSRNRQSRDRQPGDRQPGDRQSRNRQRGITDARFSVTNRGNTTGQYNAKAFVDADPGQRLPLPGDRPQDLLGARR